MDSHEGRHPLSSHGAHHGGHADPMQRLRRQVKVTTIPVTLRLLAPQAKSVSVVGSFDDGKPHPMKQSIDGYWHVNLDLKRGRYEYHYLVDGVPTLDPKSFGVVPHPDGTKRSLLEVGY